jgi:cystathionine beta-lyase/cystathionine gamma-synthase
MSPLLDLSSTYGFEDVAEFAQASDVKVGAGYVYSRWANPTVDAFQSALADLENAEVGLAFASGMAGISSTLIGLTRPGDRVVTARQLYGGSHALMSSILPRYGIDTELCDVHDYEHIEKALDGAKVLYCETIGNPRIVVADLPKLASLAKSAGATMVVDSTFATPVLCRPLDLGVDIVVHSATKFLGGHFDLLGGIVAGNEATLQPIAELARELGPTLAPFNAWLILRGMQTLPLRVERSSASALEVARALTRNSDVDGVYYPALEGDDSYSLCTSMLNGLGGGTLGFELSGGRERARLFQEALEVITPAASLGGTRSVIVNAATITHTQLSAADLEAAGISEGFCRLSIGLEDPADLIEDLEQALTASAGSN